MKKYKVNKLKQQTIGSSIASTSGRNEQQEFNLDLCNAMLKANIPLNKLKDNYFKKFLEKHCKRHIPDESTLRKNYISPVYRDTIQQIKAIIGSNYIWFTVDETTDSCGRYIANLMIGILCHEVPTKGYLISSKELSKTNSNTISKFVHEGLANFFLPEAVPSEKVLLMLSDAAAYMVKASTNLKVFYGNLIHCTCLAHGINRIAETIRLQFPLVNKLISNGKKIFVKAPLRVQMFKERCPSIPLPPEPVLTRWGTWLDAAIYYAENFQNFKNLIFEFSESTSKSIQECQIVLNNRELQNNLAYIKTNFSCISKTIKSLEKQQVPLVDSVALIEDFKNTINAVPGHIGGLIKNKMREVLEKNFGFKELVKISSVLSGENVPELNIDPDIMSNFKYAPITSVDVERSFSKYKYLLDDRRHNLTMEHLEQYLVISCFQND